MANKYILGFKNSGYATLPEYIAPKVGVFTITFRVSNIESRTLNHLIGFQNILDIFTRSSTELFTSGIFGGNQSIDLGVNYENKIVSITLDDITRAFTVYVDNVQVYSALAENGCKKLLGRKSVITIGKYGSNMGAYDFDFININYERFYAMENASATVLKDWISGQDGTLTDFTLPTDITTATASFPDSISVSSYGGEDATLATSMLMATRETDKTAPVAISGTYTGDAPTRIFIGSPDKSVSEVAGLTAAGGNWSGTVELEKCIGAYLFDENANYVSYESNLNVGEAFVVGGQSNGQGQINGSAPDIPAFLSGAKIIKMQEAIALPRRNLTSYEGDFVWTYALSVYSRLYRTAIAYSNVAVGGSSTSQWQPGQTVYNNVRQDLDAIGVASWAWKPDMFWWQGESDASEEYNIYRDELLAIKSWLTSDYGIKDLLVTPVVQSRISASVVGTARASQQDSTIKIISWQQDLIEVADNLHVEDWKEGILASARISQYLMGFKTGDLITRGSFSVSLYDNPVSLSITDAPNGTYSTELTFNGEVVYSGDVTYSSGAASVNIPLLTGANIKGYVVNDAGTDGAVIVDITE